MFTILGSIFGVTDAYLKGKIEDSTQSVNPFIDAGLYYNNNLVNSITGSIDASGNVSLSVNGGSVTASGTSFPLALSVKNIGNVDAYIHSVMVYIEFYNGETLVDIPNECGSNSYYLTFVVPNTYSLIDNTMYILPDNDAEVKLTKNGGNNLQILSSVLVDSSIPTSQLVNKNFKIHLIVEAGQEGLNDL